MPIRESTTRAFRSRRTFRSTGSELAGSGSFVDEAIFSIPLQTPIFELPLAHVVATVKDQQGNRTKVDVRFSITQPAAELRILSADWALLNDRRLTIRFREPKDLETHALFYSDNLNQPRALWKSVAINSTLEGNHVRRAEVHLPPFESEQFFLQLERPY
jgi:hypothetical protein